MAHVPTAKPPRKLSWLYEDLAHQIILPHQLAAMLILRYLAKGTNNSGTHFVSRATMCADCGGLSTNTFNRALKLLKSIGLVTWKRGFGNQHSNANVANTYQLHMEAMSKLIKAQGVFIPTTRTFKPDLRLLHGDELTARVVMLADEDVFARAVREAVSATSDNGSGMSDGESGTSDYCSAASDDGFATSDNRPLTLYNLPSTDPPSVSNPLQASATEDLSAQGFGHRQPLAPAPAGQCVPPLRAIIAPSRNAQCADKTLTFDEGMWYRNTVTSCQ